MNTIAIVRKGNVLVIVLILAFILLASGFGIYTFLNKDSKSNNDSIQPLSKESITNGELSFQNPIKTPHWEANIPEHESELPGVPVNVVINFNFDLSPKSSISITKDGKEYGVKETLFDSNKLGMRKAMDPSSPDGIYKVDYDACWPDGSCHKGVFQFSINSKKTAGFIDMTGQKELTIDMNDISFSPANIIVSSGTKITWINKEPVGHYINTDPHPGHNYYPDMNSKLLNKDGTYSITLLEKGFYPYHCSAHAEIMKGQILVR